MTILIKKYFSSTSQPQQDGDMFEVALNNFHRL